MPFVKGIFYAYLLCLKSRNNSTQKPYLTVGRKSLCSANFQSKLNFMYDSVFQDIKTHIVSFTGLERDALHIYVGIGVFLITSLLFKNHRYRWFIALFVVIAAASMGEVLDRHDQLIISKHWYWQGSVHDIVNTCFFPTLFTLILTFTHFFERNFERNIAQTHGSKR